MCLRVTRCERLHDERVDAECTAAFHDKDIRAVRCRQDGRTGGAARLSFILRTAIITANIPRFPVRRLALRLSAVALAKAKLQRRREPLATAIPRNIPSRRDTLIVTFRLAARHPPEIPHAGSRHARPLVLVPLRWYGVPISLAKARTTVEGIMKGAGVA